MKDLLLAAVIAAPAVELPMVPDGAVEYTRDGFTQSIFRLDERRTIRKEKITKLENKDWLQSGGMLGIDHVSRKFRTLPKGAELKHEIWSLPVLNTFGNYQYEHGIYREYPEGTRFDDVLLYKGRIFEHRVREKVKGEWKNRIVVKEPDLRPPGYKGLSRSCSDCHDQAGSGGYGVALIPGGDGVFSDPLDWTLIGEKP